MTFLILLLLFTVIPAIEIALFVVLGGEIGPLSTFAVVIFTGVAGASLARMQGFAVLMQMQNSLATGRMPTEELIEGAIVLFGGALLLTPGFLTDFFGLSCLVPLSRRGYAVLLKRWAAGRIEQVGPGRANVGGFRFWAGGVQPGSAPRSEPIAPNLPGVGGGGPSDAGGMPSGGHGSQPSTRIQQGGYAPPPSTTGRTETIDASFSVRGEDEDAD
jgi:UPF0716 protein FxsA